MIGQIQQRKVQSLEAKLTIHGGPLGGKLDDFQSTEMITITIPKISIFIQTDKPIYKPGQTGNKTNHLYSFMDGTLKAEACISDSITVSLKALKLYIHWQPVSNLQIMQWSSDIHGPPKTTYSVIVVFESYVAIYIYI